MAIISLIVSAVFAFLHWLYGVIAGNGNTFLKPFIAGAIGIFVGWTILSLITTIITLIRYKKDPLFKDANQRIGIKWRDYKRMKGGFK